MLQLLGPLAPFHCSVHSLTDKPAGEFTFEDGRTVRWEDHYRVELTPVGQPTVYTVKLPPGQLGQYAGLKVGDFVLVRGARVTGKNGRFNLDFSNVTIERAVADDGAPAQGVAAARPRSS